jgi:hypothetical protein
MNRSAFLSSLAVLAVAGLAGCSSESRVDQSKKAVKALDKIQGKAQVLKELDGGATDAALNAGGPSLYLWEGTRRYRLFIKAPVELVHGDEYVVEGVYAQKAIEEIGDPDQGKNGYPLESSCERVVKTAWAGLPFDVSDGQASVLRTRIKRYPARPVFLVTRIQHLEPKDAAAKPAKDAKAKEKEVPEVTVAADKQRALLVEGSAVQTAPLWEPAGGTVRCKVIINPDGKIGELETGAQLCETVQWSQFRYQPPVQGGHPVKVKTEVEVRFEPRKTAT